MGLLYITADQVGAETGGGKVTAQEVLALRSLAGQLTRQRKDPALSSVEVFSRANLGSDKPEPWKWDEVACTARDWFVVRPRLAHFYSGTFGKTVSALWRNGCKVCYTIAAHDRTISNREHEEVGLGFPYPHLVEEPIWQRYIDGYRLADVIVCPSTVAAETVRAYGSDFEKKRIEVIPHGCHLPDEVKPPPPTFTVGYLGSYGADKGVRYLLQAWKRLNYKDGSMLVLAGRESISPWVRHLIGQYGGGAIHLAGWQTNISDFYNRISLYVQPSATEGWGCEVAEAMAHGRVAVCSYGAGAVDMATSKCKACDVDDLCKWIDAYKTQPKMLVERGEMSRAIAQDYTWDKIRARYQQLWTEMLS